jgi:hypothetical protein
MKFAPLGLLYLAAAFGPACTSNPPASPGNSGAQSAESGSEAPAKPKGPAYLLRYVEYRSGARLELVNPSHTTALEQYSKVRADPSRKVTSEEWMTGLIEFFREQGWPEEERRGSAPAMARDSYTWALELVGPGGTTFVAQPVGAKGDQLKRLLTFKAAFIDTYNNTPGFQAVQTEPGKLPFKQPQFSRKPGGQ